MRLKPDIVQESIDFVVVELPTLRSISSISWGVLDAFLASPYSNFRIVVPLFEKNVSAAYNLCNVKRLCHVVMRSVFVS